ncbi:hypothetical protein [Thermoactinospora rubra]|uniref:hypothetical protein n=1 Tax=Thermoactinospora rubra TaxID=1088767 RepID=UPI000A0FAB65|nr:hypothetical protein [Thermoactinospora rubra]
MNDFDFLEGTWTSTHRYLSKRLAGCDEWEEFTGRTVATRHWNGMASVDEIFFPERGDHGLTIRIYDKDTDLWSIYWASSKTGKLDPIPVVGRFEGNRGEFYSDEVFEGTPIRCRFVWTVLDKDHLRWEQAFSADGERTWETNWVTDFTRA